MDGDRHVSTESLRTGQAQNNFKFKLLLQVEIKLYLGVDTRMIPLSTSVAPGHDTLQLTVAHDGATGVTLTQVEDQED